MPRSPAQDRDRKRAEYAADPEKFKRRVLQSRVRKLYGLELDEYEALMSVGYCAVCGETEKKLHLDHCHTSGKVRGVLCCNCNMALGQAGDSAERLRALADWLDLHG